MSDIIKRRGGRRPAGGRLLLRLEPGLHAALREAARAEGTSLNDYLVGRIAAPAGSAHQGAADTVARAAAVASGQLAGIVAFGSWTRGEVADSSDVDVLVVVDPGVRLSRALYRRWDERPVDWGGRSVEPHFVHLPEPGGRVSGLWAEVAIDGVVLFERGVQLSALLVRIRREILAGRLVRRLVHGQPYWSEGA
jgi:predicted nucleotidyltransferase